MHGEHDTHADQAVGRVAAAYDAKAELYASLFRDELRNDEQSVRDLAAFAELAAHCVGEECGGPVLDLGCGPGSAVDHLAALELAVTGLDLSAGQIEQARAAFPDQRFEVGDLTALDVPDGSLGGIVSRYSVIHLPPAGLPAVFAEWHRALRRGAPLFLAFFGSRAVSDHGSPFDHKVTTAYELHPETVADLLGRAGFVDVQVTATPLPEGGRPFDHTTILAMASEAPAATGPAVAGLDTDQSSLRDLRSGSGPDPESS